LIYRCLGIFQALSFIFSVQFAPIESNPVQLFWAGSAGIVRHLISLLVRSSLGEGGRPTIPIAKNRPPSALYTQHYPRLGGNATTKYNNISPYAAFSAKRRLMEQRSIELTPKTRIARGGMVIEAEKGKL
jgi:hypothetical protein